VAHKPENSERRKEKRKDGRKAERNKENKKNKDIRLKGRKKYIRG
jgi:hypothetical protein